MYFRSIVIALALSTVNNAVMAQLAGLDLSTACQSGATQLLASPFGSCARLTNLVSVITASGSIVDQLDTYFENICTTNCTSDAISTALGIINQSCAQDLAAGTQAAVLVKQVVTSYPTIHDAVCLESTSNSTLCITQLLNEYQTSSGSDLTLSSLTNSTADSGFLSSISSACTDCNQALYSIVEPYVDVNGTTSLKTQAEAKCGNQFVTGGIPSTVSPKTTNDSAQSDTTSTPLSAAPQIAVAGTTGALMTFLAILGIGVLA